MRLKLQRHINLLGRVADAQRHHFLIFSTLLQPNTLTRQTLSCLGSSGVLLYFFKPTPPRTPHGRFAAPHTLVLRYWEGRPLMQIVPSPRLLCSYQSLARRAQQGGGATLLLWAGGRLELSSHCLARRCGGQICASVLS